MWEPKEKETSLDAKHPHVVSSYTGIAALYEVQGKPEEVVGAQAALKVGLRVKGAATAEECVWYPCGAHGRFSGILLPRHEEKPFHVLDMMRTGGNS
jgi:hypothetical protein